MKMLSKKEKIGAEQLSRHRDMYISRAFNKLNVSNSSINNGSKVTSIERLNNGDKKLAVE
jgi:hypothetical protein